MLVKTKNKIPNFIYTAILLLSLLPIIIIYLFGETVNYSSYGAPKALLIAFYLYFLISSNHSDIKITKLHIILLLIFSFLTLWLSITGFYSLSMISGFGILITSSCSLENRKDIYKFVSLFLINVYIFLPFVSNDLIEIFRYLSIQIVDGFLHICQIEYSREAFLYTIKDFNVEIWERCSGYSTIRILLILFSFTYVLSRKYLNIFIIVPVLSIIIGITINVLRICIHIVLLINGHINNDNIYHELIGIIFFAITIFIFLYYQSVNDIKNIKINLYKIRNKIKIDHKRLLFIILCFVLFGINLILLPKRIEKRIDHKYSKTFDFDLTFKHINRFTEWPGGGTWIVLENPIKFCYRYLGWENLSDNILSKNKRKLKIDTVYEVEQHIFNSRFETILFKIFRIDLFKVPIKTIISIKQLNPYY